MQAAAATILEPFKGLNEDEKRFRLALRLEQLKREAPTSLRAHARFVHRTEDDVPLRAARHHDKWVDVLEDSEQYPYVVLVVPPGYGKSTWVTVAYTTWRIGATGGRKRLGLIANTDRLAWSWAGAIKESVLSENFQKAYPHIAPDMARGWRHNELFFRDTRDEEVVRRSRERLGTPQGPNPSLYAAGMNGQVQSKRFDEIILDDPTTWQDALSETKLDKQKQWLKNTLFKRFPPGMRPPRGRGGRAVVVLTRWTSEDVVPLLVNELGFALVHMPALGEEKDPVTGEDWPGLHPLWPEKEDEEELLERQEDDPIQFALVDQGDTSVVAGDVFDEAWLKKLRVPLPRTQYERVVLGIDTSSGKKRAKGDYTACVVLGLRGDRTVDVLHVFRNRLTSPEQEDKALDLMEMWEPDLTVIEDQNEGTALLQRLVAMHVGRATKGVNPVQDKESRATPAAKAYRQGLVFHAGHTSDNDDEEGLRPEMWLRQFTNELKAFPGGRNDDMVDALAHAYNELGGHGPRARVL